MCWSIAGYNLELVGNGKPELQATAIRSRFSGYNKSKSKQTQCVRDACVGLAGNNPELAGNGNPELQAIAIRSRFSR